jgi:hypothetical protein
LVSLQILEERFQYDYYMHADDDSYVRLDLILKLLVSCAAAQTPTFTWQYGVHLVMLVKPAGSRQVRQCLTAGVLVRHSAAPHLFLLLCLQAGSPKQRFYWGYIWDGTGNRCTAPIRNVKNKSHMPVEQVGAFQPVKLCSRCGTARSWLWHGLN